MDTLRHKPAGGRRGKAPVGGPAREPLSYALGTRAKVGCLRVLATTSVELSQREVARRAGLQHRSGQLALDELVAVGLVRRIQGGREFLVRLSPSHYLASALQELFRAESEMFLALRGELIAATAGAPRHARPRAVALFGSVARGDDRPGSDLDLLVIANTAAGAEEALARLAAVADAIKARYGPVVRPIAYGLSEARRRWRRRQAPLPDILRDHISLVGPPLRELLERPIR